VIGLLTFPLRRPAIAFLLWAIWLSLEYWALGPFSYLFIHDNADQSIPYLTWVTRSAAALWSDPLVPVLGGLDRFAGTAWLAAHQPFFLFLPAWLAHGAFIALQRFLAGYFTFRFLRDALRVRPVFALLAGAAYPLIHAENGELRLMHVFNEPGLPVLLWGFACIPAAPARAALPRFLLLSLLVGSGMGMVDAMPFFVPVAFAVGWLLRADTRQLGGTLVYTAWSAGVCLLALPWKIPGLRALLANAEFSHRADWVAGLGWRDALLQLAGPRLLWLVGWWLVALLALPWLLTFWRWRRPDFAALLLLAAGLFLGPLVQALAYQYGDHLGVLRGVNWFRFDRLGPLALLAAGALGLQRVLRPADGTLRPSGFLPAGAAICTLLAGMILYESGGVKRDHLAAVRAGQHWRGLYGNPEVAALAAELAGRPARVASAGAYHEFHPLFNLAAGLECADGYAVLYPERYQRYWREVLRPLLAHDPRFHGHFTGWGSRAYLFHSQVPADAARPSLPFAAWYNLDLLALANVTHLLARKPIDDPRLVARPSRWTEDARDAWSARPWRAKLEDYRRGDNPGARLHIYTVTNALPRVFFAPGTRRYETLDDLYRELGRTPLETLRKEVFLLRAEAPEAIPAAADTTPGSATVEVSAYTPADLTATADTPTAGWLVCSNTFYPGWTCEVNGQPAPLVPAYGTFLGVRLPAGRHTVRWRYQPAYAP
jgi:hypothetical protein